MKTRYVNKTGKNADGDITSLCNGRADWSPRKKQAAIEDIEGGEIEYCVKWKDNTTRIRVVGSGKDRYLRTDRDASITNNLGDLPNC